MKCIRYIFNTVPLTLLLLTAACNKSSLEVTNLNQPPVNILNTEAGVIAYAKGFYKLAFGDQTFSPLDDAIGMGMFKIVLGYHEGMGDMVWCPYGNSSLMYVNGPLSIQLDNGTVVSSPIGKGQIPELRLRNSAAYNGKNALLNEWTYMYFLNNATNVLLSSIDQVTLSGDAAAKKNVLKAWAYWWKGYAYSRIGSMYIAGVITDSANGSNGNFVTNQALITEAVNKMEAAKTILSGITATGSYNEVMNTVIPGAMQFAGRSYPSPQEWIDNINTFEARTLLVNKKVTGMATADWATVLTLANAGIKATDYQFCLRTVSDNATSVFANNNGWLGAFAAGTQPTEYISERFIQDFKPGDKRLGNNFGKLSSAVINVRGRGINFGTRWYLLDKGTGNGAYTYFNSTVGATPTYIAGSYEENELMKAECLMHNSSTDAGLAILDAVRNYQGAGLAATSGTGLTLTDALEELRKERRCALFLRGLGFYDLRRNGMNLDVSRGGGRKDCVVLDGTGNLNTKCIINYAYNSYWDVPQNELDVNPATVSSAPLISQY
jgi:hypothetical protein